MKKILILITIAAVHFVLTRGVIALTMSGALPSAYAPDGPTLMTRILVVITKVLYFPLITLALFPRNLFPGDLINIPIFLNSILWACILYVIYSLVKRSRRQ